MLVNKRTKCRAILAAAVLTGFSYASVYGADSTSPLSITDKDAVVNENINVGITPGDSAFHVVNIDKSASGGTVRINSQKINVDIHNATGPQLRIDGVITNTGSVDKINFAGTNASIGYEGTVNLAEGLTLTVDGTGTCPKMAGIYENGFESLYRSFGRGSLNTGRPANLTYNLGDNTTITMHGQDIVTQEPDPFSQYVYYSQTGIINDGGIMNAGDNLNITSDVKGIYTLNASGINNTKYGQMHIGDNAVIKASGTLAKLSSGDGAEVYGIISRHNHVWEDESTNKGPQVITLGKNAKITVDFNSPGTDTESPSSIMGAAIRLSTTDFTADNHLRLITTQENSGIGTYGLFAWNQSKATIGDDFQADVTAKGNGYGVYGVYAGHYTDTGSSVDGTDITFKGNAKENLVASDSYQVFGNYFNASSLHLEGNEDISIEANGKFNHITGVYMLNPGADLYGQDSHVSVTMNIHGESRPDPYYGKTDNSNVDGICLENQASATLNDVSVRMGYEGNLADATKIKGISDNSSSPVQINGSTEVELKAENTGKAGANKLFGIYNHKGTLTAGDVHVKAEGKNIGSISGIKTTENGSTDIEGNTEVTVSGDTDDCTGILSTQGGRAVFHKGVTVQGAKTAIESDNKNSLIKMTGDGMKVIEGNFLSTNSGIIRLSLHDSTSSLTGVSTVQNGETNLTVSDGAVWNMTGNSEVTSLEHSRSGVINMNASPAYETLHAGSYTGNGGIFLMKTDLDSEKDGDKVTIDSVADDSSGLIMVKDSSLKSGNEVTGVKNLLLVTDTSGNATFKGQHLDEGGLWDVTPVIKRGDESLDAEGNAVGDHTEWYLTKVEKKVNKDTVPLIKAPDNSYALYRLDIDSLRKRMGDFRFRNLKDTSGIWARDFHGSYDGQGINSKYNGFQLGYDYAANDKSVYGFFAERNISSPKYSYGDAKDHGLSGGLYGTWFGDSGVYTDVVAKWGRDDTELKTWGNYPDRADYRTHNESLSVEFGKTFTKDNGLFLEPEAQMVFGHLGSKDYTTRRGKTVHMGGYDSAIGRLGILFGKRVTEGEHPYDYYLKFSVLHKFGGSRSFHLAALDGETMDYSEDYQNTWEEAGFGGSWHISKNTNLYADAERSFGGNWHKKWQWNIGVNWQF